MNKRYRRPVWAAVLCSLFAVSCDSGDIFEKDKTADGGVAVRGTFELLNPEVFPQQYDLIFGVFAADGTSALSSVNVLKPADGEKVQLSIDNVPDEARSVRFSLINSGRQVVHTFFEYDLDDDRTSTSICRPFRSTCWSTTAFSGWFFSNITAFRAIREPAGQAACC
mgnify:CR=1 FL=1